MMTETKLLLLALAFCALVSVGYVMHLSIATSDVECFDKDC